MIKAVIFDVGGVLIRTHDHTPRRALERRLGLDERESEQMVFHSDVGTQAQSGVVSNTDLWAWIGEQLALDDDQLRAFRRDFWAGDVLDTDLVDYVRALRPAYQTAIISNATDDLQRTLTEQFAIADAFDLIVCSAEEKVMKPDVAIYRRALQQLGREPAEAVFVDDSIANVAAARDLGMHAIHYRPGTDVPAALAKLGVHPPMVHAT